MTDLYLIAHVVRGQPAFDIATQVELDDEMIWIIPTSGHRAYPYWSTSLDVLLDYVRMDEDIPGAPEPWIDHYAINNKGHSPLPDPQAGLSLLARLGLIKPAEPFKRRV